MELRRSAEIEKQFAVELERLEIEKQEALEAAKRNDDISAGLADLAKKYDASIEEICAIAKPHLPSLLSLLGLSKNEVLALGKQGSTSTVNKKSVKHFLHPISRKVISTAYPAQHQESKEIKAKINSADDSVLKRYSAIACNPSGIPLDEAAFQAVCKVATQVA